MHKNKTKVAIISQSLHGGGAERFAGLLSVMLDKAGYEIHHIIIEDKIDFEHKGIVCNLGKIDNKQSGIFKKAAKGLAMRRYLKRQKIDAIIDNRPRNAFVRDLISKFIFGKRKVFYVVHSYNLKNYFPASKILAGILYERAEKIVCVSKAIEAEIKETYGFENTAVIYNPVAIACHESQEMPVLPEKFILFFGRLQEKVKNFSLMLDAFSISGIHQNGYRLVILGSGPDLGFIEHKISALHLKQSVRLIPFRKNPYDYVKAAKFTVLTSHYEGFPMSVIESLALGTPVVSVDCKSGPSEVIRNRENGLIVPNHNPQALAIAMQNLAQDANLYDICKSNAAKSVAHLTPDNISVQWQQILPQK